MTASLTYGREHAQRVDRACELTSIGAGHAAGALASLIGRPCEMSVPAVRALAAGSCATPFAADLHAEPSDWAGTLFEVQGGLGGVLAVFLPPAACEQLFAALLGKHAALAPQRESTLREVGNILASHALSAIGDTLRTIVLPSVPALALRDAPAELARVLEAHADASPLLRVEVELRDRTGELRGLLVYATPLLPREATPDSL